MWRNLLIQAFYQVTVLLILNFAGLRVLDLGSDREHAERLKNTMIFNTFVLCQIFNEFNARKPDELNVFSGVTKNHLFVGIVGMTFILQILIIMFLGNFFTTVRLSIMQWLICGSIAIVAWPLAAVGKLIPVPKTPLSTYVSKRFRRARRDRNPKP
ncbi:unnamed protein product [Rhodiola kirilowii]